SSLCILVHSTPPTDIYTLSLHDALPICFDPFRIHRAGPHDTPDFFLQTANDGALRPRVVAVINRYPLPLEHARGHREPASELVIIVGIQDVVLAIVLIVNDGIDLAQARFEQLPFRRTRRISRVGVMPPDEKGLSEILFGLP